MEKTLKDELKARKFKKLNPTHSGTLRWEKAFVKDKSCSLKVKVSASQKETRVAFYYLLEGIPLTRTNQDLMGAGSFVYHQNLRELGGKPVFNEFFDELNQAIEKRLEDNPYLEWLQKAMTGQLKETYVKVDRCTVGVKRLETEEPVKDDLEKAMEEE